MYHGILNVYKEAGFTSHDVVAKLRGICKQKKIGHTGTLDPDAVGVLPVCLGSATKICGLLTDKEKEYEAVLRLGVMTDTQDMSGRVLEEKAVGATEEEIRKVIFSFVGEYDQIPPMYSAVKINGKRLYELARSGQEVEREPRRIQIKEIEILSMELPEVTMRVTCSKGTYIRTLCHDIGEKLGCGGAMASLERRRSGDFRRESAYTLGELQKMADQGRLQEAVRAVEDLFRHFPAVEVEEEFEKRLRNGNRILDCQIKGELLPEQKAEEVRIYDGAGVFYGIYRYEKTENCFYPVKLFFT